MSRVTRHEFIPEESRHLAYEDIPLPIGEGQTVSQPYIVAMMINALDLRRTDQVLEVGTGSGYQAAVLAEMAVEVITVERIESLAEAARQRLGELGYTNVAVEVATDALGWPEGAPYNAIVVAASAPKLPRYLMEQLAEGGRMVVPVGSLRDQELMKVTRSGEDYSVENLGGCRFVPLIGVGAWDEDDADARQWEAGT